MTALETLPRAQLQAAKPTALPRGVLVVDDDEMVRSLLGTFFRQQGFFVWLASDGEEAVEIFENYHDEIAFVVMEVHMPGMTGPDTLLKFREFDSEVDCYFISEDWSPDTVVEVMESGGVGLVMKQFLLKMLAGIMRECLASSTEP
jgi:two-component system NtrC family response regulator